MEIDSKKVDEAVLALLYLTRHQGNRAWKSLDWEAMNRLFQKGLIEDPFSKAKSVVFTHEGLAESARLCRELYMTDSAAAPCVVENAAVRDPSE